MRGTIYNKRYLPELIQERRNNLVTRIEGVQNPERLDLTKWKEDLIKDFRLGPLVLGKPEPSEPVETYRSFTNDWGGTSQQKMFEIKVRLPFEGDWQLFECYGSQSAIVYPKLGGIGPGRITFTVSIPAMEAALYQNEVGKVIGDISSNIPTINREIASWDDGLPQLVADLINRRFSHLEQKRSFMEQIGLKVNPASNTYMVPPPVAKKAIPKPAAEAATSARTKSAPTLSDDVYIDIKEVLFNVGRAIERKPSLYIGRSEEDLRDMFLLFLETRYEATAGVGEAFNKEGKTDILLKYAPDGTNLFIAECKFWKGAKGFRETIDQLFRYLTTRDSKAALMMFVSQKEFQAVVGTMKEAIREHPQYRSHVRDSHDSSIAYEFSLPDDSQKAIQIEVMLFHFPKTAVVKE